MISRKNVSNGQARVFPITVKKLCAVLKIIDITTFFQIRVTRENKFFVLSNDESVISIFAGDTGDYFAEIITRAIYGKISTHLWPSQTADSYLAQLQQLNIWNGISVALRIANYADVFSFAAAVENQPMNNFYINHFKLLKRFIVYFRLRASKIIENASCLNLVPLKRKIKLNDEVNDPQLAKLRDFKKSMQAAKLTAVGDRRVNLTLKETEYLTLMLEGKSMSKTSKELGVSVKAVASGLDRIKSKTGCYTKTQLLSLFFEQQTYQPSIFYDRYY